MSVTDVAVVGGSGFIGTRLTARLIASGHSVRLLDRSGPSSPTPAEWWACDVLDRDRLGDALHGVGTVYNLAAARGTTAHPWETYRTVNVEGARNVCDAAAACGVTRIVFTSSAAVYGTEDGPDELAPCRPRTGYGRSKLAAEHIHEEWLEGSSLRSLAIVRPSVVFGPGDDGAGRRLIGRVAHPAYRHAGRRTRWKSMAYVDNVVAFLEFVGRRPDRQQLFNYTDVPDLTIDDMARIVRETLGLPPAGVQPLWRAYAAALAASVGKRTGRGSGSGVRMLRRSISQRLFDARRAHESGFEQLVDPREGLARTAIADFGWVSLVSRNRR